MAISRQQINVHNPFYFKYKMQPFSISSFVGEMEAVLKDLDRVLEGFEPKSELSYGFIIGIYFRTESMSFSTNRFIDSAVHKIASNHLQKDDKDPKIEYNDSIREELGLSEDQSTVMRSIEIHSPAMLHDVISQYKYVEKANCSL